jgi:hypothetical protein
VKEIIQAIVGCYEYKSLTFEEEQLGGFVVANPMHRWRRLYIMQYTGDYFNKTNAYRQATSKPTYLTSASKIELCRKGAGSKPGFTPGLLIWTCGCIFRRIGGACLIDQYETVHIPFSVLMHRIYRRGGGDLVVVYDNACHLLW